MQFLQVQDFDQWRSEARRLIASGVGPDQVSWSDQPRQPSLFADPDEPDKPDAVSIEASTPASFRVPNRLIELARTVGCHRDAGRWTLLYRTLWRVLHDEPNLLQISTDEDVHLLLQMEKAVKRDVHKMKAFVRFRKVVSDTGTEHFIAWHRPDHRIVRLAAPFFSRRFKEMTWTILTPNESVTWDQSSLEYGGGVARSDAPRDDALEELWKTYYASVFNPARVKVKMMKSEMPVRHWPTLPEAELIDDLLHESKRRVELMVGTQEGFADTATKFIPQATQIPVDLGSLRQAAAGCRACELHCDATQTVFGEGPPDANVVFIGEQPGDCEDLAGRPFVGPAGQLLDRSFLKAGLDRKQVYLTNAVKHFKHTIRGKRRIHQKPNSREIYACRPWLEAELTTIRPSTIVCLGATASQALIGRDFRLTENRGRVVATDWCDRTLATWHPAAILRMQDRDRRQQMESQLVVDIARAVS